MSWVLSSWANGWKCIISGAEVFHSVLLLPAAVMSCLDTHFFRCGNEAKTLSWVNTNNPSSVCLKDYHEVIQLILRFLDLSNLWLKMEVTYYLKEAHPFVITANFLCLFRRWSTKLTPKPTTCHHLETLTSWWGKMTSQLSATFMSLQCYTTLKCALWTPSWFTHTVVMNFISFDSHYHCRLWSPAHCMFSHNLLHIMLIILAQAALKGTHTKIYLKSNASMFNSATLNNLILIWILFR